MSPGCARTPSNVQLQEDEFGVFKDKTTGQSTPVRRFTWTNANNVSVQVITYGATITSIKLPDKNGKVDDITLGFNDLQGYQSSLNRYFGATIGRVANRIGSAKFTLEGVEYSVTPNQGKNQLHGGATGFDKVLFNHYVNGKRVVLSYKSADNEEGFPGDVVTNVSFELTDDNKFLIDYKASTTKPTYVNLTNHSYFNLAGNDSGADGLFKHVVSINADQITETDDTGIPTGTLLPVGGTVFDLRIPRVLEDVINNVPNKAGYDHNFCVTRGAEHRGRFVARVAHPPSGRSLEVYSNQPGVQFYTANALPEDPKNYKGDPKELLTIVGKGANYYKHAAFCLETQNYPDAINHKNFPKAVLYPGDTYFQRTTLKFGIEQ